MAEFHKDLDSEDPFEFVACRFVSPPGHDADLEMARTFVEEYALMGYAESQVRALFETRFYAAPYGVLQRRGPGFVDGVIREVFGPVQERT